MSARLFDLGPAREERPSGEAEKTEAAPGGPLRRVVLLVAYDGGPFHGFAVQAGPAVDTVAGRLLGALEKMVGERPDLTCAGRTDAGVHARGQVVHVDLPAAQVERWLAGEPAGGGGELPRLAKALSSQCGPAISVGRARVAAEGFDARRSALSRRYSYRISRRTFFDPTKRYTSWHVPGPLDLSAMRIAADALLGEHDFTAFCRRPPGHEGPLDRRVLDARLKEEAGVLVFEIEANAFCHHMVRSIVGCLVAVGREKMNAAQLYTMVRTATRLGSAEPAPPEGLVLEAVRYPDELVPGGILLPLEPR